MTEFVQPATKLDAFNCPHCGSYSDQYWYPIIHHNVTIKKFNTCMCRRCGKITIWKDAAMIFPSTGNAAMPNSDMPDEIKNDYNEARDIVSRSPRSACALLRLCIEKICTDKVSTGKDLNEKIKKLSKGGLNDKIIKALDSVRVIGGQAVHPLKMDLKDDVDTATRLFDIINYISNWAYTSEKAIDHIYKSLPEEKKEAIKKRDS